MQIGKNSKNILYRDCSNQKYIIKISRMQEITQNIQATKQMTLFCFQTLQAKLKKQKLPDPPSHFNHIVCPIFVTWTLQDELRGCIGTFSPQSLSKILGKYALISALKDDRFDPISLEELPKLSVCVSLLVNFKSNQDLLGWEIGRHGIIIYLKKNGKDYQATYLPEVAREWEWTHEETLKSLLQKSGCRLPLSSVLSQMTLTTYESSKVKLAYEQYTSLKLQSNKSYQKAQNQEK